jgi:hypothetical protein
MVGPVSGVESGAARRPGDPVAILAVSTHICAALGWTPQFDDLDTIVAHAQAGAARRDAGASRRTPDHRAELVQVRGGGLPRPR